MIWVAILCKKRVFVYGDKLSDLLANIRAFPAIGAWHRQVFVVLCLLLVRLCVLSRLCRTCCVCVQSWDLVRPIMGLSDPELKDLQSTGVYVAGFTDPECFNRKDLYDVHVNLPEKRFSIPDHAKGLSCALVFVVFVLFRFVLFLLVTVVFPCCSFVVVCAQRVSFSPNSTRLLSKGSFCVCICCACSLCDLLLICVLQIFEALRGREGGTEGH